MFLDANAHSLFNSSEETLGNFRVQIATQPEFPQIGEKSQVLIRVTDLDIMKLMILQWESGFFLMKSRYKR